MHRKMTSRNGTSREVTNNGIACEQRQNTSLKRHIESYLGGPEEGASNQNGKAAVRLRDRNKLYVEA